jgi:hypothetical protein
MDFTDKELDMLIAKKVDKAIFYSENKPVFTIDFNNMIRQKIETDETLKKQLLQLVLKSDD